MGPDESPHLDQPNINQGPGGSWLILAHKSQLLRFPKFYKVVVKHSHYFKTSYINLQLNKLR